MTSARASRARLFVAVAVPSALLLVAVGCGDAPDEPTSLNGVYRMTASAHDVARIDAPTESAAWGTWTLVLERGRFAFTRESDESCTWAYGALGREPANRMDWTVIDAGGIPPGAASIQPRDAYRFTWSRYRDVLTLSPMRDGDGSVGYFAAKPWRRISDRATAKELSRRCPPAPGVLDPTGAEHAIPAAATALDVSGDLVRTGPATWTGSVTSKQLGRGRLSIGGNVVFAPPYPRVRLTFAARFSKGELRGCSINGILRRPHARYLWDGEGGQITSTSPQLHAYLGLPAAIHGVTLTSRVDGMHGGVESFAAAQRANGSAPRDLC